MDYKQIYDIWASRLNGNDELSQELRDIKNDDKAIEDRFYQELAFGTAGLRGVLGAGTNRMNIYTVGKATQGLAEYLKSVSKEPKIAIAYDSRINSTLFAEYSASVMAANGVKVYIYKELMPTPALSYAVRELKCDSGINVTASHNPSEYNGYKVYDETGCQITGEVADAITKNINNIDIFEDVKVMDFEKGLEDGIIEYISDEVVDKFIDDVLKFSINPDVCKNSDLKLVYTPLNGAGRRCVTEMLKKLGITDVTLVKEQEMPDGHFPTCPYPNPEIKEALQLGLNLTEELNADLLLATDPDCDRVGAAVMSNGKARLISGNEMGVLLIDYISTMREEKGTMPKNPVIIKSIVSTTMADAVALAHNIKIQGVLTGFKYIGEAITNLQKDGREGDFLLGFEESYGYLNGSHVRDKDAVDGSMLIVEMAAYYKKKGMNLGDALDALYKKFGRYLNKVDSYAFKGSDGMAKMQGIMESLRNNPPKELGSNTVTYRADYNTSERIYADKTETINLPKSNILEYGLGEIGSVIVRPSGTEPKLKIYYSVKADTLETCEKLYSALKEDIEKIIL